MDASEFIAQFQDYLAPKLDTYEQAIYVYLIRHSRLVGKDVVTTGFKSARARMACGIGEKGRPMSEGTAYGKLASLQSKGCLKILRTTHAGRELRLFLPSEIPGAIPPTSGPAELSLDDMDFFSVRENRLLLLERENHRCFYTLQKLDRENFVVDHVVPRPEGGNNYFNCVAASREANNKKGSSTAEDFLRRLFREGYLSDCEFDDRIKHLEMLREGKLKPIIE